MRTAGLPCQSTLPSPSSSRNLSGSFFASAYSRSVSPAPSRASAAALPRELGKKSLTQRSRASAISLISHPAWQWSRTRRSSPSAMLKLLRRSSWAGHSAVQPPPLGHTFSSNSRTRCTVPADFFGRLTESLSQLVSMSAQPAGPQLLGAQFRCRESSLAFPASRWQFFSRKSSDGCRPR